MICLDCGALIALIQETGLREDQVAQRGRLVHYLETHRGNQRLLVPSVAFAEFLYGLPQVDWVMATSRLAGEDFFVAPFTLQAAVRTVEIRRTIIGVQSEREAIRDAGTTRNKFRADYQILATALVHGGTSLVTTDPALVVHARRFRLTGILIDDIPDPPPTGGLFDEPE